MRLALAIVLFIPCTLVAQQIYLGSERPEFSASLASADLALVDVEWAQVGAANSLGRLRARQERASKEGLEEKVLRMPTSKSAFTHPDRAWPHVDNAKTSWAGFVSSAASAGDSGAALVEARAAVRRLVGVAKEAVSAGAAKESLEQPGIQRFAVVKEAERRLNDARSDRTRALTKARALENDLVQIQALHRQAVLDATAHGSLGKAREADRLALRVSKVAADAALVYAEAARHSAYEIRMAHLMADAYAELGSESIGFVLLHSPTR